MAHQAAKNSSRKAYGLINTSAGKLSWLTKRRIISSVKGHVRYRVRVRVCNRKMRFLVMLHQQR
jgi:acetone carboxylase gamma subunit